MGGWPVSSPDDKLSRAAEELRLQLDFEPLPQFSPNSRVSPIAAVAAVVLLVVGLGAANRLLSSDGDPQTVVATQPETEPTAAPEPAEVAQPTAIPEAPAAPEPTAPPAPPPTTSYAVPTKLTDAAPGEFVAPLPQVSAFNADETLVLLYRTGSVDSAHIVLEAATGVQVTELSIDSPDIEHVYWNPLAPNELTWLEGVDIVRHDARTNIRSSTPTNCDAATTGPFTSPPSQTGVLALACQRGDSWTLELFDIANNTLTTSPHDIDDVVADIDSMQISPSGVHLAITFSEGVTSIVDLDGGIEAQELETGDAIVTWVTLPDGAEALALADYGDIGPGTIVVLQLNGDASVLVGPDAGDEYPPDGTGLSATTGADGVSRIVATVRGPAVSDSPLTGMVVIADITGGGDDTPAATIETFDHDGEFVNDYWSSNFVAISPSGRRLVWASDEGTDRTNTFILDLDS